MKRLSSLWNQAKYNIKNQQPTFNDAANKAKPWFQENRDRINNFYQQQVNNETLNQFKQQVSDLKSKIITNRPTGQESYKEQKLQQLNKRLKQAGSYFRVMLGSLRTRFPQLGSFSQTPHTESSQDQNQFNTTVKKEEKQKETNDKTELSQPIKNRLQKAKQVTNTIISTVKTTVMSVIEIIDKYVITPFKSKENFSNALQLIKKKFSFLIRQAKEEKQPTVKDDKGTFNKIMSKIGIDSVEIKKEMKGHAKNIVVYGFFSPRRLKDALNEEINQSNQIREPTKFEQMRRDFTIWRQDQIIWAYTSITSEENKDRYQRFKMFFKGQKSQISEGIVKYRRIMFWWKVDEDKFLGKSRLRRYWSFRNAKKQGVIDLYMGTLLIIGCSTLIFGIYRGRNKDKEIFRYQEEINKLKMDQLNLEKERLKLLYELVEIEDANHDIANSDNV